jgi:hypothetical protein
MNRQSRHLHLILEEDLAMKIITAFGLASLVALGLVVSAQPSAAMVIYPWCAHYGGGRAGGGGENCGFTSFAQCQATRAGNGGFCVPNPWYQPYPPPTSYAPPLRR